MEAHPSMSSCVWAPLAVPGNTVEAGGTASSGELVRIVGQTSRAPGGRLVVGHIASADMAGAHTALAVFVDSSAGRSRSVEVVGRMVLVDTDPLGIPSVLGIGDRAEHFQN